MSAHRLDGKVAFITGSGGGMGRAEATLMAERGADIIVHDVKAEGANKTAELVRAMGRKAHVIIADVTDIKTMTAEIAKADKAMGKIDILVNNAGIGGDYRLLSQLEEADFDKMFNTHVKASFFCAKAVVPGMKARKWGRIVNVLNSGAKWQRHGSAPTSISRAAGMALTKVLSNEGAAHNVLVNAVLVGLIQTDQWVRGHAKENKGCTLEEYLAEMAQRIPLNRVGTAEEFANMILFLSSDAGSYVTGTAINVDGGMCPVV